MMGVLKEKTSVSAGYDPIPALKALAHPLRFRLFTLLASGEKCVCDLVDEVNESQPLVSHHLSVLRKAKLVNGRQDATWNYYSVNPESWNEVRETLAAIQPQQIPTTPCPPEDTCC